MNAIKEIIKYQTDRQLDKMPYDGVNESVMALEELLEVLGYDVQKANRNKLKHAYLSFIEQLTLNGVINKTTITPDSIVDAWSDLRVIAIGATMKAGYKPEESLLECSKEINSRKGAVVDGKFQKDTNQDEAALYKADYSTCLINPKS